MTPQIAADDDPSVFDSIANLVSAKETDPDSITCPVSAAIDMSEYWSDALKPLARKCTILKEDAPHIKQRIEKVTAMSDAPSK